MVTVTVASGGSYCVDSKEVTWADYVVFQAANYPLDASFMPAECVGPTGNTSWIPPMGWPPNTTTQSHPYYVQKPVRHVDWCDAWGYCASKGRRLCGAIDGGNSEVMDANTIDDQWFNACSAQDVNVFPYGSLFDAAACIDDGVPSPLAQPQVPSCLGGFPGLYNMSGNVAEWVDSCEVTGGVRRCLVRGGSYLTSSEPTVPNGPAGVDLQCDAIRDVSFLATPDDVGFRCCLP
jgi:formylglycine-generating enzyme required for sulfatase activity